MEQEIRLNKFVPRDYQLCLFDALENKGYKRIIAIWPRRAGKDLTAWNICIRELLRKVQTIYYIFPTFSSGRRILWDAINNDGFRILDYLPFELTASRNEQLMRIKLINGSVFQIIGSDTYDTSLIGTNPQMVIFSEFALSDPMAYSFVRPILSANGGTCMIVSTPRGKNHLWDLYQIAKQSPRWFVSKLTIEDTKHISLEDIMKEREDGEMSEDLQLQEYWTSFQKGVEGSYYTKYIDRARLNGQIGMVPWESNYPVHTAWDLGVRDSTAILFFQVIGTSIRIIDAYEKNKEGLEHYINFLKTKPYTYGKHIAPHDIRVREFSSGNTRWEKARQLGVRFEIADKLSIEDGIEAVRSTFSKLWIDERNCKNFIKAIENYRQEYDSKRRVYKPRPLHDCNSHHCFTGDTKILTEDGNICIEKIKVGMRVKTPTGYKKVLAVHEKLTSTLCDIEVGNTILRCTKEHSVFTQGGLKKADALRYSDGLEYHGAIKGFLWKMIYGYYTEALGLKGFKKTILSLKTSSKFCLMASFIDGMENIILEDRQRYQNSECFIGRFGFIIMAKFQRVWSFIIKITTLKTIRSKILRCSKSQNTLDIMQPYLDHGLNHKNAKTCLDPKMKKLKCGIEAKKELNGTGSTQKLLSRQLKEQDTKKIVSFAQKNTKQSKPGKNSVLIPVKQGIGLSKRLILSIVIAVFVRPFLTVIGMLSKKHVVKNVQYYQCSTPKRVYDLTIEDDNCYYANGYLVSNSDALRYLCISLPKLRDGMTAEDLEKSYREAVYGEASDVPNFFRDDHKMY